LGHAKELQQESLDSPAEQGLEVFQLGSEEGMEIFDSHLSFSIFSCRHLWFE